MNRREFFTTVRNRESKKLRMYSRTSNSGLQPYSGTWTDNEVTHLLRRTMFGAKRADVEHFLSVDINSAVDELLSDSAPVTLPLRDYGVLKHREGSYNDTNVPIGSTWTNDLSYLEDPGIQALLFGARLASLRKWWVGLMVNQQRSVAEKMVLFWHHHYSVQQEEVRHPVLMYRHLRLLRENALGNAKQLARDVTIDPAMLYHLNGYLNSKVAPDENYARELQELFTVGKGVDSLYTEQDVLEAARTLTGWRVNRDTLTSYADVQMHDTGNKKFSPFYNNITISGNTDALQEINALIDMIFNTTESARYLCRKLYRFFVNSVIDDIVEANVIIPLADILKNSNYEVKPALQVLFKSEHFYDVANRSCYIKSPLDLVVGSVREFNVAVPSQDDHVNGYPLFFSLYEKAAAMGLDLCQPPDVNGWPAYIQDPMYYHVWVNSNSLPQRADFTNALIYDGLVDEMAFATASCADPADAEILVRDITRRLLSYPLSDVSIMYIKNQFLLSNSTQPDSWADAWNSDNSGVVVPPLKKMLTFICNLPEYHLC